MSANDNHTNQHQNMAGSEAADKLQYIEDMLQQLRKMADSLNQNSLNYFLDMAISETSKCHEMVKSHQNKPPEPPPVTEHPA
ncbi:MAG: hypothetical protein JKX93_14425 [Rhizobiaceae bacterium]|nr:hypothetical protein [Rhizobiaceae bacterium]